MPMFVLVPLLFVGSVGSVLLLFLVTAMLRENHLDNVAAPALAWLFATGFTLGVYIYGFGIVDNRFWLISCMIIMLLLDVLLLVSAVRAGVQSQKETLERDRRVQEQLDERVQSGSDPPSSDSG